MAQGSTQCTLVCHVTFEDIMEPTDGRGQQVFPVETIRTPCWLCGFSVSAYARWCAGDKQLQSTWKRARGIDYILEKLFMCALI